MQVLTRVLRDNVKEFGEYPFLYDGDTVFSNVDGLVQAERIRDLLVATGVQPGDRILVSMPNRAEVFFVYQGAMMAGAVVVPVMYLLGRPEIAHILQDAEPVGIFTDRSSLDKVLGAVQDAGVAPGFGRRTRRIGCRAFGITWRSLKRYDPTRGKRIWPSFFIPPVPPALPKASC